MREIKFRCFYEGKFNYFVVGQSMTALQGAIYDQCCLMGFKFDQFTGLLDKNGKEIFEGDILQSHYYSCPAKYVIEWWDNGAAWFPGRLNEEIPTTYGTTFKENIGRDEIIGNIYENPELL